MESSPDPPNSPSAPPPGPGPGPGPGPDPDDDFDDALLFHALTFVEDPAPVLAEVARVLRPGGRVIVSTLGEHRHHDRASAFGHVRPGFRPADLEDALRAAGFEVASCQITSRERRPPHYEVLTAVGRSSSA